MRSASPSRTMRRPRMSCDSGWSSHVRPHQRATPAADPARQQGSKSTGSSSSHGSGRAVTTSCPDTSVFSFSIENLTELHSAVDAPGAVRAEGGATDQPQTGMEPAPSLRAAESGRESAEDAENSPAHVTPARLQKASSSEANGVRTKSAASFHRASLSGAATASPPDANQTPTHGRPAAGAARRTGSTDAGPAAEEAGANVTSPEAPQAPHASRTAATAHHPFFTILLLLARGFLAEPSDGRQQRPDAHDEHAGPHQGHQRLVRDAQAHVSGPRLAAFGRCRRGGRGR